MRLLVWILALMAICFLAGLLVQRCSTKKEYKRTGRHNYNATRQESLPVTLDTVRPTVIEPIRPLAPVVVPILTRVQARPDTARRRRAEKQAIITGLDFRSDSLVIQTIDPKGLIIENQYPRGWVQTGKFQIDSTGQLHIDLAEYNRDLRRQKRRRTWRKIGNAAITAAAAAGAFILGQTLVIR